MPGASVESLLQPELPAGLNQLYDTTSQLLTAGWLSDRDNNQDVAGTLKIIVAHSAKSQQWHKNDQILAANIACNCCNYLYSSRSKQSASRVDLEVQHYAALRKLVALGCFDDGLVQSCNLLGRLELLVTSNDEPSKDVRDLFIGGMLNMLVSLAEAGAVAKHEGNEALQKMHSSLQVLSRILATLPAAEQAKHRENVFRYLYKLSIQSCTSKPSALSAQAQQSLFTDLLTFCASCNQSSKMPLIISKLASDIHSSSKHAILAAVLTSIQAAGTQAAGSTLQLLYQGLEHIARQASHPHEAAALLHSLSIPDGAPAAALMYIAALQVAAQAPQAGTAQAERATSHAGASTSGRQHASGRPASGKQAPEQGTTAPTPAYLSTLATFSQQVEDLMSSDGPTAASLLHAAQAAAATQALRSAISKLPGQAASLQAYASIFTPAAAQQVAAALAAAPRLLQWVSRHAGTAGAAAQQLQPASAAASALLAIKIIAAHTLHTSSTGSRAQMLSTLQQYASSLSQLLSSQAPLASAGHDDATSAADDAGTQLASSLAQMSLDSSAGQAALSGQELQWLASSMHNLGVELLSKQYQQRQELQQQMAAAVLQLSCQACLCQMQALGNAEEHLPEVIKKAKAQLGCLKKAGRQAQLVHEADVVMLQLWRVRSSRPDQTVMVHVCAGLVIPLCMDV